MTPRLSPDLDLNLPACRESLPPPALLSSADYFALLAEQMALPVLEWVEIEPSKEEEDANAVVLKESGSRARQT